MDYFTKLKVLKGVPGIVWKKSEGYRNAYKYEPFAVPAEWLEEDEESGDEPSTLL